MFLGQPLLDGEGLSPELQVSMLLGGHCPVNPWNHCVWIPDKVKEGQPVLLGSNKPRLSRFTAFRMAAFLTEVIPQRTRLLRLRFPDKAEPKPAKGMAGRHRPGPLGPGRGRGDPSEVRVSALEALLPAPVSHPVLGRRGAPASSLEAL